MGSRAGALGAMQIGKHATVKLVRLEEYYVDVRMYADADPEEEAGLLITPETEADDWETVHSEIVESEPIYEDDPDAWLVGQPDDEPSAPSENTYWDDSRHFTEEDDG